MRNRNFTVSTIGLFMLATLLIIPEHRKAIVVVLIVALLCYTIINFVLSKKRKKSPKENTCVSSEDVTTDIQAANYLLKKSLITQTEKPYFETIKKIIEPEYIIQPQINLASIIDKKSSDKFRNELFRNIDFGIFDQNYKPILLIEINDESHMTNIRRERDKKVQTICKGAGIPIVTLWTKYGINEAYINKRLCEHLTLASDDLKEKADSTTEENNHERNDKT